jgi:hypothetical protein
MLTDTRERIERRIDDAGLRDLELEDLEPVARKAELGVWHALRALFAGLAALPALLFRALRAIAGGIDELEREREALEAPPIRVLYRRGAAGSARVRVFIEFIEATFRRLKALRAAAGYSEPKAQEPPAWFLRLGASAFLSKPGTTRAAEETLARR